MSTKDIVYVALFAALTAALALFPPITMPVTGVPITAQSMGAMLAGSILGARRGALSQVLFLILVAAGLPLLAGGRGGFGVFLGPSGGFLVGWAVAAFAIGWLVERYWDRIGVIGFFGANLVGGVVVLYAIGIPWVAQVAGITLWQATAGSAVFIPGDLVKAGLTAVIAVTVRKAYPLIARQA